MKCSSWAAFWLGLPSTCVYSFPYLGVVLSSAKDSSALSPVLDFSGTGLHGPLLGDQVQEGESEAATASKPTPFLDQISPTASLCCLLSAIDSFCLPGFSLSTPYLPLWLQGVPPVHMRRLPPVIQQHTLPHAAVGVMFTIAMT